ncbi:collagen triple helix repeat-containing protein 1-like [Oscarella lobularis]|uniref:collagen triple helix repeat-containing protein 1-like n=1 Tax=Oscarella lobularis TaxID=121494 RepID=UPI0033135310
MIASSTLQCLFVALILFLNAVESNNPKSDQGSVGGCSGVPGIPGSPGHNGLPGRDGLKGDDGMKGAKGDRGDKGVTGKTGPKGSLGQRGSMGPIGIKGEKGIKGSLGQRGEPGPQGENGTANSINWKQCVWKREDGKDTGLIQECVFKKRHSSTALKVAYAANTRVYCLGSSCCGRWYITFNGAECSGPMTIEGVVFLYRTNDSPLRHRQIEGFCKNIPSGSIRVAVHVGNCQGHGSSNRRSGWNSVSRIMIEEYPQSQT